MAQNLEYKLTLNDSQFQSKMGKAVQSTSKLDNAVGKLGGVLAGAFAVSKVVDFGKAVIESYSNYEMFMSSITTMLGGNRNMAEALNSQLTQLAKTTPFSLEDVQKGSKQLLAYGFAAGNLTKDLSTLGNVASGVGAPLGDIVYLYGTLKTQGRAYAKDINQFTGRGIPIIKELAKQFKVTDAEVMNLVKDGKIGFAEIEKAFKSMTSEGGQFFNLMEEQSKTIGGKISNLGDTWEQIRVNIGKSQRGILSETLSFINTLSENLNTKLSANNFTDEAIKASGAKATSMGSRVAGNYGFNTQDYKLQGESAAAEKEIGEANTFSKIKLSLQVYKVRAAEEQRRLDDIRKETNTVLNSSNDPYLKEKAKEKQREAEENFSQVSSIFLLATKKLKANAELLKTGLKPDDKGAATAAEDSASIGAGISESVQRPQNLYINIDKLVENQNITTNTLPEALPQIKAMVSQVFLEVVNDANGLAK